MREVPHFRVKTTDGVDVSYEGIWQQRPLVLVVLPQHEAAQAYVESIAARAAAFDERHTACVVTRDPVAGMPPPSVVVADQWGEVTYTASPDDVSALPSVDEILEWVDYTRMRCPECEGEAR